LRCKAASVFAEAEHALELSGQLVEGRSRVQAARVLSPTQVVVVNLVDDHAAEWKLRLRQFTPEVDRLFDWLPLGRRHEHEAGPLVRQQLVDPLRAVPEAGCHLPEALKEVREVLKKVYPGDPLEDAEHSSTRAADHLHPETAGL